MRQARVLVYDIVMSKRFYSNSWTGSSFYLHFHVPLDGSLKVKETAEMLFSKLKRN